MRYVGEFEEKRYSFSTWRTEGTCLTKVHNLKRSGDFERFRRMFKEA